MTTPTTKNPARPMSRRETLALGATAAAFAAWPAPARARIEGPTLAEEIAAFAGAATPQEGSLVLEVEPAVEDGYNVPVRLAVEQSFGDGRFVTAMVLLAPENPLVRVATFHFTRLSGAADVTTRIRVARDQTLTALAKLSDGTVLTASRPIAVTVGGCDAT
ncbi:thiosulfate oxidation carrier protein SoxY [Methylobrevis albus]|uniref:Thiosulfate oxidation carrier protein SoxY n=1 Tax=Methylobrevis albus TaxID=2793297 RepID=A0A931MXS5_9HYPH|nr:thiosulfate oxidation carrier protein SoxY [Methylobrevis albus]MBH0237562.1 thiosulfate oxidation carrier protein SoxY [Methylobrevis albus]